MEKPPDKKSTGDGAREIAKAIVSIVPGAGGPLAALIENVFQAPLERRRQQWFEQLSAVITELEKKAEGLSPDNLSKNEAFISAVLQATQIAHRTHQAEKLEALRNAIFNSALPTAPDDDLKSIFLKLIDDFTPTHLRMLALLDDPIEWMKRNDKKNPGWDMGGVSTVVEYCLPELNGKREIVGQIVRDLQAAGLVSQGGFMNTTMTGGSMVASHSTAHGKQFIGFISRGT